MVGSNSNGKKRKLINLLIRKEVQIRVITRGIIYMLLAVIISGVLLLNGPLLDFIFGGARYGETAKGSFYANSYLALSEYFVPLGLILIFFYILHLLLLTHRFCGPLENFKRNFKAVGDGNLSARIILRKKDYLGNESRIFNTMVSSLAQRIEMVRNINIELINEAEDTLLKLSRPGGSVTGIRNSVEEIKRLAEENNATLSNFK